jgi:predicted aminopeptidase
MAQWVTARRGNFLAAIVSGAVINAVINAVNKSTFALLLMALSSCYLTKQGYRQLGFLMDREPLEQVLKENKISALEKQKLKFTQETVAYAASQGLQVGEAYQDFVQLTGAGRGGGDSVSYTVQAAMPLEIKLKTWWFPIVGSVPYLGFFDKADRDAEAKDLLEAGYEVHLGGVTAYSSLGWFSDPVFSSMLRRTDVELAHLYFHELTHRTLWVSDSAEFNENLAEFIADHLAEKFFNELGRSNELAEFRQGNLDYQSFREWLQKLRADLERNLDETKALPTAVRIAAKDKIISFATSHKPSFKLIDFVGLGTWNNPRILGAGLYAPDVSRFEAAKKCYEQTEVLFVAGNFLKSLGKAAENTSTGFAALESMCERPAEGHVPK